VANEACYKLLQHKKSIHQRDFLTPIIGVRNISFKMRKSNLVEDPNFTTKWPNCTLLTF